MTEEDIKHLEDDSAPISDEERVQTAAYIRHLQKLHAATMRANVRLQEQVLILQGIAP